MLPGTTAGGRYEDARVTMEKYPKPDRSQMRPNFAQTLENMVLDIAWGEGAFSDGRPFRVEFWRQEQVTLLTYFFSTRGLENISTSDAAELLVKEGLIEFLGEERYVSPGKTYDYSGNEMWSVNIIIGDGGSMFVYDKFPLKPYDKPSERTNNV